jgi:glucose-6-phosphate 1-epimerase
LVGGTKQRGWQRPEHSGTAQALLKRLLRRVSSKNLHFDSWPAFRLGSVNSLRYAPRMSASAVDFRSWEIPRLATFHDGPGGLVYLRVATPLANAELFLQGAHITRFQPAGIAPVLFLSSASQFAPGKPIRGGVPVVFPWFGGRAGHPEAPAHGFARTLPWQIETLSSTDWRTVSVVLRLEASATTRELWPHDFVLRHHVTIGTQLEMMLEVENTSSTPFQFEEALHTYLVSDVRTIAVTGLADTAYIDKVDGVERKQQDSAPVRILRETDRVYLNTRTACQFDDPDLGRRIVVTKTGSDTTVLWNPWIAKAKAMTDFGDHEWPGMVCIETANAADNAINLAPGATHRMTATIAVERL